MRGIYLKDLWKSVIPRNPAASSRPEYETIWIRKESQD